MKQRKLSHLQRASLQIQAETLGTGIVGSNHSNVLKLAALKDRYLGRLQVFHFLEDEEEEIPVTQQSRGGRSSKKSSPAKRTPKTKTPRAKSSTGRKKADAGSGNKSTTEKKRGRPAGKTSAASKASAGGRKSSTRKTAKQKREEEQ